MGFMDKAKDLYALQKQAKELKAKLKKIHVESVHDGITVTITGEQEFIEVKVEEGLVGDPKRIGRSFVEAANKAIKKSQQVAADQMKGVMGDFGGLFGGQ